jgi:hypothetical protein
MTSSTRKPSDSASKSPKRGSGSPHTSKSITVVERWQRGGVVAYSIDEGKTFHATVRQAFEHRDNLSKEVRWHNQFNS